MRVERLGGFNHPGEYEFEHDDERSDLSGKKVVLVYYGGETLTAAGKAWLEPFQAKTGAHVATDSRQPNG